MSIEAFAPDFAAPDPSTGPEAPPEEIISIPIQQPFEDKPIDECIKTSDVKVTASIQPVAKLNLKQEAALNNLF